MRKHRGFSLIEILVAAVVFTGATLMVLSIFPATGKLSQQAQCVMIATNLAELELEESLATDYDSLAGRTETHTMACNRDGATHRIDYTVEITVADVSGGGLRHVTARTSWTYEGETRNVYLESYVADLTP